jgi:hypothetical protein
MNESFIRSINQQINESLNNFGAWRSWLAYLHGVQGVGSSSLLAPTIENEAVTRIKPGSCFFHLHTVCTQLSFIRLLRLTGKIGHIDHLSPEVIHSFKTFDIKDLTIELGGQ